MTPLTTDRLRSYCDLVLRHVEYTMRANRRDDGLYHSYSVASFTEDEIRVDRLTEMLEGQVAAISSGALDSEEAADLLDTLRHGPLYRADQGSYMLYPDRQPPLFFDKNVVDEGALRQSRLLAELLRRGDGSLVSRDVAGHVHFNAGLRNANLLRRVLDELLRSDLEDLAREEHAQILELYEQVFAHRSFTGRSGSLSKYEGLGSIYWHMVSKLLLAVQEMIQGAVCAGEDDTVVERLKQHYAQIREGIGVHKSPEHYGAVPTDPYSHTPAFAGAQQPGMTGQVKEDIITRVGEMGVMVRDGRLKFLPELVSRHELLDSSRRFMFYDVHGDPQHIDLAAGSLAFTLCQVPVVMHGGSERRLEITVEDGSNRVVPGLTLDPSTSACIFDRSGAVRRLDVFLGLE